MYALEQSSLMRFAPLNSCISMNSLIQLYKTQIKRFLSNNKNYKNIC
jgi:hypothetical protein